MRTIIECKFLQVPVKLSVHLKSMRGTMMLNLSPNLMKLRFKKRPEFKMQIVPVLYDMQINLSLLKHTLRNSITAVIDNEFVNSWFRYNFFDSKELNPSQISEEGKFEGQARSIIKAKNNKRQQ